MRTRIAHVATIAFALASFVFASLIVMGTAIETHTPIVKSAEYVHVPGTITWDNDTVDVTGVEYKPSSLHSTTTAVAHSFSSQASKRPVRAHGESYRHYWTRLARYIRAHGPACEYEDASGPRDLRPGCYWDSATAGAANGGLSFVALNHGVTASGEQRVVYVYSDGHFRFGGWGI